MFSRPPFDHCPPSFLFLLFSQLTSSLGLLLHFLLKRPLRPLALLFCNFFPEIALLFLPFWCFLPFQPWTSYYTFPNLLTFDPWPSCYFSPRLPFNTGNSFGFPFWSCLEAPRGYPCSSRHCYCWRKGTNQPLYREKIKAIPAVSLHEFVMK